MTTSIAMLLFPRLTQLDLTAPFEIFSRCPSTTIDLVAATLEPVRSEGGLPIIPTRTFDAAPLVLADEAMSGKVSLKETEFWRRVQAGSRSAIIFAATASALSRSGR